MVYFLFMKSNALKFTHKKYNVKSVITSILLIKRKFIRFYPEEKTTAASVTGTAVK